MATVKRKADDRYEVELSRDELGIILACVREAWEALSDDEFRVRTGFDIELANNLRTTLRSQIQSPLSDVRSLENKSETTSSDN